MVNNYELRLTGLNKALETITTNNISVTSLYNSKHYKYDAILRSMANMVLCRIAYKIS